MEFFEQFFKVLTYWIVGGIFIFLFSLFFSVIGVVL